MIEFQTNVPKDIQINYEMIRFGVQKTLETSKDPSADVTIRFTDDEEMLNLNKAFRGIQEPTDVLSFNQDTIDPDTQRLYLGDIIISYERAEEQSSEHHHGFDEECSLLAIHGTLHLLGYDHYENDEKEIMWKLQEDILRETIHYEK